MMMFFELAGGIALTIFGVRFLRKGLDRLFAGKLVVWLSGMTQKRWKAFASGMGVGALAPSSTALSLITLQMLDSGRISTARMLAVLLGVNVGITVTVQLLAFRIQDYAGLFIVLGVLGFQFLNRTILRGIGQCLLSLGFVFLAMQMIGSGASQLVGNPEMSAWMSLLEGHPLLVLLFVMGFALCVQSSTTSIGFAIALAGSGVLSPALIIPWVIGTNLGISLTALAAGWKSLEGRRLAVANLLVKLAVALPIILLPVFAEELFALAPGSLSRKVAMLHTGFNLAVGLLFLPFIDLVMRFVRLLVVPTESKEGLPLIESYLDPNALDSPAIALANATREMLQMADGVKLMLQHFWRGHLSRDLNLTVRVQQEDDRVDLLYGNIKNYLSRIGDGMTEEETKWQFALLTFSTELEAVGDIIEKNLCDNLRKQVAEGSEFSDDDAKNLAELYERVLTRFEVAVGLLTRQGGNQVAAFLEGKEYLNEWYRQVQQRHYERLRSADTPVIASSTYFLDMLNSLRRINSHITTIGYAFPNAAQRKQGRGGAETVGEVADAPAT